MPPVFQRLGDPTGIPELPKCLLPELDLLLPPAEMHEVNPSLVPYELVP